jgi:hypothetical protein
MSPNITGYRNTSFDPFLTIGRVSLSQFSASTWYLAQRASVSFSISSLIIRGGLEGAAIFVSIALLLNRLILSQMPSLPAALRRASNQSAQELRSFRTTIFTIASDIIAIKLLETVGTIGMGSIN